MKTGFQRRLSNAVAWLFLVSAIYFSAQTVRADETFDLLKTKTATYTNVTVTTKAKNYVFILHSTGMANIRVSDLPFDVQKELGYIQEPKTNQIAALAAKALPGITEKLKPIESQVEQQIQANQKVFQANPMVLYAFLGGMLLLYVFFSYCGYLICLKAKSPPSALIWVPVLQLIPLLKAAGMSGWWFVACFIPGLNLVAQIIWSLKIAQTRGKSVWAGIGLLIPAINIFVFLYLAFSPAAATDEKPSPKYRSMSLQTA